MIKKMRERLRNQKGMTLIELLAVIVILGVIAAIAIPAIGNIIENSKFGAVKSDAIMVINAAKLFEAEHGVLPGSNVAPATADAAADIKDYLEGGTTLTTVTSFSKSADGAIQLTGSGAKDPVKVTYSNATINDINLKEKYSELTTTGAVQKGS